MSAPRHGVRRPHAALLAGRPTARSSRSPLLATTLIALAGLIALVLIVAWPMPPEPAAAASCLPVSVVAVPVLNAGGGA